MAGLRRQFDPRTVHFEPLDAERRRRPSLAAVSGVERVEPARRRATGSRSCAGTDPSPGHGAAGVALCAPARIELARLRLEDVFIRIVADGVAQRSRGRALRASLHGGRT